MVPSKLRHANKKNEWGQKSVSFGKESFSKKENAVVDPVQRPGFLCGLSSFSNQTHSPQEYLWCGVGKVYLCRKLLHKWAWLWESCMDSGDQPAEHELSGLGKDKCETFRSTNGREGWKIGPGPQAGWKMSRHSGSSQVIKHRLSSNSITSLSYLPRERTLKINSYF